MVIYRMFKVQDYMAVSLLDTAKTAGYPVYQLNTHHRAVNDLFHVIHEICDEDFGTINSPASQQSDNHPDALLVKLVLIKEFLEMQLSPEERILPVFLHVLGTHYRLEGIF